MKLPALILLACIALSSAQGNEMPHYLRPFKQILTEGTTGAFAPPEDLSLGRGPIAPLLCSMPRHTMLLETMLGRYYRARNGDSQWLKDRIPRHLVDPGVGKYLYLSLAVYGSLLEHRRTYGTPTLVIAKIVSNGEWASHSWVELGGYVIDPTQQAYRIPIRKYYFEKRLYEKNNIFRYKLSPRRTTAGVLRLHPSDSHAIIICTCSSFIY